MGKATAALRKLMKKVRESDRLILKTKTQIYQTWVLSALIYGSETWILCVGQERRLNNFHMRCLRNNLKLKWQDRVQDIEVLKRAGIRTPYPILRSQHLRWHANDARMDNSRIPKQILYRELSDGTHNVGRPTFRFKDQCKTSMVEFSINVVNSDGVARGSSGVESWCFRGNKEL